MARPLRLEYPGALYHLTARGDNKAEIFLDNEDRNRFLKYLGIEVEQQRWICYAWCLMRNHYHLLIETPEGNLITGMRRLNGRYTQSFNRRHERTGHVFQGRYKSILVEKEAYLYELCRYISLNPVRADIVARPEDWPWSSYRATVGLDPAPEWLAGKCIQEYFGGSLDCYHAFVLDGIDKVSPWEELRGQIWLGGNDFLEEMRQRIGQENISNVPMTQLMPDRPDAESILRDVAENIGCTVDSILSRAHRQGYHLAAYLLRRRANIPLKDVAGMFGVSVSRISHIQKQMDMKMDDHNTEKK
jgi:REP element-mobilizing transposase RayT